jgi:hypothetical protein
MVVHLLVVDPAMDRPDPSAVALQTWMGLTGLWMGIHVFLIFPESFFVVSVCKSTALVINHLLLCAL